MLMAQVRGVTAKSWLGLGEPPVSETNDVRTPLVWATSETVTAWELVPTVVIPGKVRGVVEIWATARAPSASTPMATSNHRFSAPNMFEPIVRREASTAEAEKLRTTLGQTIGRWGEMG